VFPVPGAATVPVPLPTDRTVDREAPSAEEVPRLGGGIRTATAAPGRSPSSQPR
jgi:hypothetical protein